MVLVVNSFRAGELSPRVDRLKSAEIVASGVLKARNIVVNPQGGARKRPGLKRLTQLPSGEQWRRIFAWDKSPQERLNVCYASSGAFRVMLRDGSLIDVSGAGNEKSEDELQFHNLGNRVVMTDGRELRHILANPVTVGGDVILLTRQMDTELFATNPLRNFVADPVDDYEPPADQPISLSSFSNGVARLSVGELRSVFVVADGGAGAVTDFTNNPHTYKGLSSPITINSVERGSDNRLRLVLSQFPAWLEKAVVSWGTTQNPDQHTREFTSANSFSTALSDANDDELTDWNAARGVFSVRLERYTEREWARQVSIGTTATTSRGTAAWRGNTSCLVPMDANYTGFDGEFDFNPAPATNPNLGAISVELLNGAWGTVTHGSNSITGRIFAFPTHGGCIGVYVNSRAATQAVFGGAGNFIFGGTITIELFNTTQTTGSVSEPVGDVTITEITLSQNTIRVTATGLTSALRLRIGDPNQSFSFDFAPGQLSLALNEAQRAQFATLDNLRVVVERANVGLEANEADFVGMAIEFFGGFRRAVYIKGRDFYTLNSAGGLERQPLVDNRRVSGLFVDTRFRNQAAVILRLFRDRVVGLFGGQAFDGDTLKTLLTTSEFLAFRPPMLNPRVILFDDDDTFNAERERIGARFCFRTDQAGGSNPSVTAGEYELEWAAQEEIDEWHNSLIPVGGAMTLADGSRPVLQRRGITNIFEYKDNNNLPSGAMKGDEATVTGWKYAPNAPTPTNLRNSVVNIPGRGGDTAGTDPGEKFDEPAGFDGSPIAFKGTLTGRRVDGQTPPTSLIGKPPGRYAMELNDTDGWPVSSVSPQNRLAYAGSRTHPARIWMSVLNRQHNFLDFRPTAADDSQPVAHANYSVTLDLDTSSIRQMVNDASLLVFTQNEAHISTGPFNAENPTQSHTRRFGRLGQEFNVGAAVIDENVFIFANGAPFGLLYDGIDIGYIAQNLSAQRNEDIMRNYDDAKVMGRVAEGGGGDGTVIYPLPVHPLVNLASPTMTAEKVGMRPEEGSDDELRPVRIVATQPEGLNGAYLVLYLLNDGTIRAFHTLHREGFFAWSRWSFFDAENTARANEVTPLGNARRRIIDMSAQGRIVTLLDDRGVLYTLDGEQAFDSDDTMSSGQAAISVELELPTYSIPDPRLPGQALLNPKRLEFAAFYFNALSGDTMVMANGDAVREYPVQRKADEFGQEGDEDAPETVEEPVFFVGQRTVQVSMQYTGAINTDKKFTLGIMNSSTEKWELLRVESQLEIDGLYPQAAGGAYPPPR